MASSRWPEVALAAIGVVQVVGLAWIAAWQQRAAALVRATNGQAKETHALLQDVAGSLATSPAPADRRS